MTISTVHWTDYDNCCMTLNLINPINLHLSLTVMVTWYVKLETEKHTPKKMFIKHYSPEYVYSEYWIIASIQSVLIRKQLSIMFFTKVKVIHHFQVINIEFLQKRPLLIHWSFLDNSAYICLCLFCLWYVRWNSIKNMSNSSLFPFYR